MNIPTQKLPDKLHTKNSIINPNTKTDNDKVLCPHCQRTATNGIKCKGICVADSEY